MLFVNVLKREPGANQQEGAIRRLNWSWPEGIEVLGEYWLESESPRVVSIVEAGSMAPFGQIRADWGEYFEIEVHPAMTAEQGMEGLRQAMAQQQAR